MNRIKQTGARRRYYARYLTQYTRKNTALIGLGILFLAGVLAGVLLLRSSGGETLDFLNRLVTAYVERRGGQTPAESFLAAAKSSLLFVGILLLSGFSAIGQPVELALPLFRGMGFGFTAASLYSSYGTSAAGYVGAFLIPNMAISTIAILFCCRESLRMSSSFLSMLSPGKGDRELYSLRLFIARYFVAVVVCLASALLEAFTCYLFANSIVLG